MGCMIEHDTHYIHTYSPAPGVIMMTGVSVGRPSDWFWLNFSAITRAPSCSVCVYAGCVCEIHFGVVGVVEVMVSVVVIGTYPKHSENKQTVRQVDR